MIVYLVYNRVNGKFYVGQTRHSLLARWREHVRSAPDLAKHGLLLARAILRYGASAFELSVLGVTETETQLNTLERLWILALGSYRHDVGYNMTFGGDGVRPTLLVRRKIGAHHKGKIIPQEMRDRISETLKAYHKAHPNAMLGKKHSPETKAKIAIAASKGRLGKKHSPETKARMREKALGNTHGTANKGRVSPRFGVKCTDETRQRMKLAWTKRKLNSQTANSV